MNRTCRIAVFYDGTYFSKISNYYLHHHERRSRISISGLHEFIRDKAAESESIDRRYCQIVDAAYFRGRLSAKTALARDSLYSDRVFEDVLMRANVAIHQYPVVERNGNLEEKTIDVLLALEAYELASLKRYDLCVLISGDGDFVPLVRKLNTLGSRIMLLGWDFEYEHQGQVRKTRTSQQLIDSVTYPIMMASEIDTRGRRNDQTINQIFLPRNDPSFERSEPISSRPDAGSDIAQRDTTPAFASDPLLSATIRHSGNIKAIVTDKGFGFIQPTVGGELRFFHVSELQNAEFSELEEGATVTFLATQDSRGRPQASEVEVVTDAALP